LDLEGRFFLLLFPLVVVICFGVVGASCGGVAEAGSVEGSGTGYVEDSTAILLWGGSKVEATGEWGSGGRRGRWEEGGGWFIVKYSAKLCF
jgi:hypothetical protein